MVKPKCSEANSDNPPQWIQRDDMFVHWCWGSELIRKRSRDWSLSVQWGYWGSHIKKHVMSCAFQYKDDSSAFLFCSCLTLKVWYCVLTANSCFFCVLFHTLFKFWSVFSSQDRCTPNQHMCSRTEHYLGLRASASVLVKTSTIMQGRISSFMNP